MKTIDKWDDLSKFGIEPLTGEACGLMYRILCDVTAKGKHVIAKCLGVRDIILAENWNRGADAEPHIGSIMLSHEMLVPLGIFALLENGCTQVWLYKNGSLLGIEPSDSPEQIELCQQFAADHLARTFGYRGTAGDRNVHMMSGRIE